MTPLQAAFRELTDIQRRAAEWGEGALLVLAGPGSGKTRVLTSRLAWLLDQSRKEAFRVLALTFTNKAAAEMVSRVDSLVPGLNDRMFIGTFHSFCTQILRQHGSHVGIKSDFTIYALDDDRRELLRDALQGTPTRAGQHSEKESQLLGVIDRLKSRLVQPTRAALQFRDADEGQRYAEAYGLYEEELRRLNALDFNSLLLETYRLVSTFPAVAARYRRAYAYWMIDEFQDTNEAQYRLLLSLAGTEFRNVFVVADDDQIIYEWNGASYRQIQRFAKDFTPELIQLPTNYRCPPTNVEAANRLVVHNLQRATHKSRLVAGRSETRLPEHEHIRKLTFDDEHEEARGVAADILERCSNSWGAAMVLARARWLLDGICEELKRRGVPGVIAQRRDRFQSAEFQWLHACLRQVVRPLDRRNFALLVNAFNRVSGTSMADDLLISQAEASGCNYLEAWVTDLERTAPIEKRAVVQEVRDLLRRPVQYLSFVAHAVDGFTDTTQQVVSDVAEDLSAWRELVSEISQLIGREASLDQFLQQLDLRSKEPAPDQNTLRLMTIHAAKGTEADFVYLVGMAEEVLPSYQSIKAGPGSAEMEEERRNCFVAITRARECLTVSYAAAYRGYQKRPSRFISEMGI